MRLKPDVRGTEGGGHSTIGDTSRRGVVGPRTQYHRVMPVDLLLVLIVILVLVLMWRGPKTLPKLGEALGRTVRGVRKDATALRGEIQARAAGEPVPPPDAPPDDQRPA